MECCSNFKFSIITLFKIITALKSRGQKLIVNPFIMHKKTGTRGTSYAFLFAASCLFFCALITFCLENSSLSFSSKASVIIFTVASKRGIEMFCNALARFCVLRILFARRYTEFFYFCKLYCHFFYMIETDISIVYLRVRTFKTITNS